MSRRRISGSIFWGLVFVVLGAAFLARNMGSSIPLWSGFVRYWPVLLIAWGLFKLVDYFGMDAGEKTRPLFSGGDIAAIVMVIVFGSLVTLAANMSPHLGKLFHAGDFDVWDLTGNSFSFSEQHSMDAPPDSPIEISNRYGDIEVMPGDVNRITVDVHKTVRAWDRAEADRLSSNFAYSITQEGSKYRIGANFDLRFKASLTIHVPLRSMVSIDNRNGKVSVQGLTGNQEITNRFGDVDVRGIAGMVKIQNQNGNVTVDDISDAVTIANTFAPIAVKNIRGSLKITGRNNSVDIEHVEKDLDVESAFQNVDIRDPGGSVTVKSHHGEVSIRLVQPPMRDISVSSEFGNINVDLPTGSAFNADVRNRFGEVFSDFTELHTSAELSDRILSGHVGSAGPTIRIDSRSGEIRIRKRG